MNKKQCENSATTFVATDKRSYIPPRFKAITIEKYSLICTSVYVEKENEKTKIEDWGEDEEHEGDGLDF